jgi:hypothetical protein
MTAQKESTPNEAKEAVSAAMTGALEDSDKNCVSHSVPARAPAEAVDVTFSMTTKDEVMTPRFICHPHVSAFLTQARRVPHC